MILIWLTIFRPVRFIVGWGITLTILFIVFSAVFQ
jgi:hypothetical protein